MYQIASLIKFYKMKQAFRRLVKKIVYVVLFTVGGEAVSQVSFFHFTPSFPTGFASHAMTRESSGSLISGGAQGMSTGPSVAKFCRSTNGGQSWDPVAGESLPYGGISSPVVAGDQLLVIHYNGSTNQWNIYRSPDAASTWTLSNTGLPATSVMMGALTVDNTGAVYLLAQKKGTAAGPIIRLFKSTTKGQTWSEVSINIGSEWTGVTSVQSLCFHNGILFASVRFNGTQKIMTSTGGVTWSVIKTVAYEGAAASVFVSGGDLIYMAQDIVNNKTELFRNWNLEPFTGITNLSIFIGAIDAGNGILAAGLDSDNKVQLYSTQQPVGVSQLERIESPQVFPNPAGEFLFLGSDYANTQLCLYSSEGRLLRKFHHEGRSIDLTDLQSGVYYIRAEGNSRGEYFVKY
jgi:hypothetical protein